MVLSKINPDVVHKESKHIDKKDNNIEASTYDIIFKDIDPNKEMTVTFGKINDEHLSKGVSYFPMYLVVDDVTKGKIGVLEIASGTESNIIDDEGDIDPDKMTEPLLFDFVNEKFVNSFNSDLLDTNDTESTNDDDDTEDTDKGDSDEDKDADEDEEAGKDEDADEDEGKDEDADEDEDKDEDADEDEDKSIMESVFSVFSPKKEEKESVEDTTKDELIPKKNIASDIFDVDDNKTMPALLSEENKDDATKHRDDYKGSTSAEWIKNFMKNDNYKIEENDGGNDSLFIIIRDAYAEIGKNTTVQKIRELLANETTDELFQNYRNSYLNMENELVETSSTVDKNKKALSGLKKTNNSSSISRDDRASIIEQAKKHSEEIKRLKKQNSDTETFMKSNFGFMSDLDTITKFQDYIKSSSFVADEWAISTLEHKLNMKLIIFSEESYNDESYDSVLDCGELNKNIESGGSFTPNYYIMSSLRKGIHSLVAYKDKRILTYTEIPYDVKMLVVNKCLEKNAGVYYMIQDFRNLKSRMGISPDEGKPEDADIDDGIIEMTVDGYEKQVLVGNELYDPAVIFTFYNKSNNTPIPGKGSSEKIPNERRLEFANLRKIPQWRRRLDNDWTESPFDLDNLRWSSVTHYVEGSKFKKGFPDFYKKFSINADADETDTQMIELGTNPTLAREVGKKNKHKLRKNKEVIDPDYFGERSESEINAALRSKFEQGDDMKELLKGTKQAKLQKFIKGMKPEEATNLMKIRNEMLSDTSNENPRQNVVVKPSSNVDNITMHVSDDKIKEKQTVVETPPKESNSVVASWNPFSSAIEDSSPIVAVDTSSK